MKIISSKLNMHIKNINVINNNVEKLVLNIIFWFFGTLVFFYVLLLGNTVKNIVERQGLEAQARSLSSEVRNLEVAYLSVSNNVDLNLSYSMGFKETKATFATRKALGLLPVGENSSLGNVKITQNGL